MRKMVRLSLQEYVNAYVNECVNKVKGEESGF